MVQPADLPAALKRQAYYGNLITRIVVNMKKKAGEITDIDLDNRVKLLESYWKKFTEIHEELIFTDGIEGTEYWEKDVFDEVQEAYLENLGLLMGMKTRAPDPVPGPDEDEEESDEDAASVQSARSGRARNNGVAARLPKLDLPKFNGEKLEWESFRDMFTSLVVDCPRIADVNKLQYLKMSLENEPANILKNIPCVAANWATAWATLTKRYDDKQVLLSSYMEQLLKIKQADSESASELKRILNTVTAAMRGLKNLKRPVDHWDDWFVHLLVSNLDKTTRKAWELAEKEDEVTFIALEEFILGRIRALEAVPVDEKPSPNPVDNKFRMQRNHASNVNKEKRVSAFVSKTERSCFCCQKSGHVLAYCADYAKMDIQARMELLKKNNLCFNCFGKHTVKECQNEGRCKVCKEKHHSLLHSDKSVVACGNVRGKCTLLATVQVELKANGRSVTVKALLDSGSEVNFISESVSQILNLKGRKVGVVIEGIGGSTSSQPSQVVSLQMNKSLENEIMDIDAYVMKNVLGTAAPKVHVGSWPHLHGLQLADPNFSSGERPEMILGIGIYAQIIREGIIHGQPGEPIAQATSLGYVILGEAACMSAPARIRALHCVAQDTSALLRSFWEIEEVVEAKPLTEEEQMCEDLFVNTHRRDSNGRYIVRLPVREEVKLGHSHQRALSSLESGERRRQKDKELDAAYSKFMNDYKEMDHMSAVPENEQSDPNANYLPHHPVWKDDKIRVVFNAAAVTSSGKSLNDALMTGPRLQRDIDEILMNWRRYPVVFTADIVKMFRGILVDESDQDLQRILWRNSPADNMQEYRLKTVTYGTSCAPWLALRTLHQLAADECARYPHGAHVIVEETYVDDCFSGGDTVDLAERRMGEVINILMAGGFSLSKWASNVPELVVERDSATSVRELQCSDVVKTLGIHWDSVADTFGYRVSLANETATTRRAVLSQIARLYDPSGWLAPVIVVAKIFLQRLWILHDWDSPLPENLEAEWLDYYENLQEVPLITIPRWVGLYTTSVYELHAFCDSSERAYAATVYIRVVNMDKVESRLLLAKTKVAPIKTLSVPRLELCGATLLCKIVRKVLRTFSKDKQDVPVHAWTDSTVVLAWLQGHPSKWRNFVANRVSDVHRKLPDAVWRHVRSEDNPADLATRGMPPAELRASDKWWQGPEWLVLPRDHWPAQPPNVMTSEEHRVAMAAATIYEPWDLMQRYSSMSRLVRVTALCKRFVENLRAKLDERKLGALTVPELESAKKFWVKETQRQYFETEIELLKTEKIVKHGRLRHMNAFIDQDGVLRLGGRLMNAGLTLSEQNPIVLPGESTLANLLIAQAHLKTMHGGAALTLSYLHREYWILGAKTLVKRHVRRCVKCFRFRAKPETQLMGQLPAARCTASRAFLHTGVDYAGPIDMRMSKGRGIRSYKGYIALFVCMATRAIHLEAVSDLSTSGFMAAFRRFVSRRGLVHTLYSDNGTNFKGAENVLKEVFKNEQIRELKDLLANDKVNWVFIPPRAPHWGGLWEAGVKSMKHHLRRVVGDTILTYEELSTVLAQIEACLNSRPLHPMSCDPNDLTVLTPGHFLVGHSLTAVPEESVLNVPTNRLSRWKLLSQMVEGFWSRWHRDYLHHLQQRGKWKTAKSNLAVNDLVLVIEDNLPPTKWLLGRVTKVRPGLDGCVRAADVLTVNGVKKRAISKLAVLPVSSC